MALSLAWTATAQANVQGMAQIQAKSIAANAPVKSASDLLMSLTLKGYDLFSLGEFKAGLEDAKLVPASMQAGFAPEMMANLRSLELGEAHVAAAASFLQVAASPGPSATESTKPPIELNLNLDLQVAELTCDPADQADCTTEPDSENQGRGVENYSG